MFRVAVLLGIFYAAFAAQVYRFDQTFDDFPTFEEEWSFFKSIHGKANFIFRMNLNRDRTFVEPV